MGASMALATYLRTNHELGGIVSFYGINPLIASNFNETAVVDQVPMLFGNNLFVKNSLDVEYTADYF